ncbi:MAG: NAD(P)/FAD-dependent oxidoreductase [Opitutaceae bacterium]
MNQHSHYDVVIIGAGMSGLAAGIRLAHFGKRVCIFERHNAVGGLNGFYSFDGRKYDVGLHALTNYVRPGIKGTPLGKLLRQLRIEREAFALCEQKRSRVCFGPRGELSLRFSNDFAVLESDVAERFPSEIDGFRRLVARVKEFDDVSLNATPVSARVVVGEFLNDPVLVDMIFCPLMYYGSSSPGDMEFGQFVIMFKALFLEGFARPREGVRVILRVLLEKYREAGGERRMKCGVRRITTDGGRARGVELDTGEVITADHIISSAGSAETDRLLAPAPIETQAAPIPGERLSFAETITILDRDPADLGWGEDTIVFFNEGFRFHYERPAERIDLRSGVICFPNNFDYGPGVRLPEGILRVTCLADYRHWVSLSPDAYRGAKAEDYQAMQTSALRFLPPPLEPLSRVTRATDMFTPRTVEKYTGHLEGAIYGAPTKVRNGRTKIENVYLCGTDQGFLGIIGAMLSGISMANFHVLSKGG